MTSEQLSLLLEDVYKCLRLVSPDFRREWLTPVYLASPHKAPALPNGCMAIYTFFWSDKCLKVGKAGPRSAARYRGQHYTLSAPSTLAKSLRNKGVDKGITGLPENEHMIGDWIRQNTSRADIIVHGHCRIELLNLIEAFCITKLNPLFEGFDAQR